MYTNSQLYFDGEGKGKGKGNKKVKDLVKKEEKAKYGQGEGKGRNTKEAFFRKGFLRRNCHACAFHLVSAFQL